MRRHVRYRPLGKPKQINVQVGMDLSREAEVVDESIGGVGLRVSDASGMSLGQDVEVEMKSGPVVGTIVRLERDGTGFHVGVRFRHG
jgi:hypothetical protein